MLVVMLISVCFMCGLLYVMVVGVTDVKSDAY